LLYDQQQTQAIYLNPTAAAIWLLCDGSSSVDQIIETVQEAYPEAAVAEDIIGTLRDLEARGVIVVH